MSMLDEWGCLTAAGIRESYRHGTDAHAAVEILLKGRSSICPREFISSIGRPQAGGSPTALVGSRSETFRSAALSMEVREDEAS